MIPSASGDFDATYTINEDGELREAVLTGVFYPDTASMTYTLAFEDYGTEQGHHRTMTGRSRAWLLLGWPRSPSRSPLPTPTSSCSRCPR